MQPLRLGLIGLGGMGRSHLRNFKEIPEVQLAAVADVNPAAVQEVSQAYGVPGFDSPSALIGSGLCEAVQIVTPHPFHAAIAIEAARHGLHVLCEKPLSVTVAEADAMLAAAREAGVVLGVMFQERTQPAHAQLKALIEAGVLGEILEVEMIALGWFRPQVYYNQGGWRGTWQGEGGGILANQAPHSLDRLIWLAGMPKVVHAVAHNALHRLEVEDSVQMLLEYGTGRLGYFRAATTDPLGRDRLEIIGEKGRVVYEGGRIRLCRHGRPISQHIHETTQVWGARFDHTWEEVPVPERPWGHAQVVAQFARAVRQGEPLIATGEDGLREVELANAAYLSAFRRRPVELPLSRAEVDALYADLRSGRVRVPGAQAKA